MICGNIYVCYIFVIYLFACVSVDKDEIVRCFVSEDNIALVDSYVFSSARIPLQAVFER